MEDSTMGDMKCGGQVKRFQRGRILESGQETIIVIFWQEPKDEYIFSYQRDKLEPEGASDKDNNLQGMLRSKDHIDVHHEYEATISLERIRDLRSITTF